ncbi:hypothetical protein A3Q56_07895 [Intoshia linei]|uniref:Chromo domain-containing protein n=1 Tax=Intoshia linei TaxID=1819745 RepID=A0A177ARA3_9BILA|nr:hypothetical protein A3Q56_07895 [Intoshia linei]
MKNMQSDKNLQIKPDDSVFEAECIVSKRKHDNNIEYLVKWNGWSDRHNTWEPPENILDDRLLSTFNERQKKPNRESYRMRNSKFKTSTRRSSTRLKELSCIVKENTKEKKFETLNVVHKPPNIKANEKPQNISSTIDQLKMPKEKDVYDKIQQDIEITDVLYNGVTCVFKEYPIFISQNMTRVTRSLPTKL